MILYHGTSTKYLDSILKDGIQPRNVTGNSNWEGKVESKRGFVYLSTAYPVYFAFCAAKEDEDLLILQVEVRKKDIYPDEDFVAFALHHSNIQKFAKMDLKDINPLIDIEIYRSFAEKSLLYNGNVAVKGITPSCIKKHIIIPHDAIQEIMCLGGDSIPAPIPYAVMGKRYRECMAALFDGGLSAAMDVVKERNRPFIEFMEQRKELDKAQLV